MSLAKFVVGGIGSASKDGRDSRIKTVEPNNRPQLLATIAPASLCSANSVQLQPPVKLRL